MSLVFNMVGGSAGGLKNTDAVLIVTVPTDSTVTAAKSGVTLTPTMWVKAADQTLDCAIFNIPASQFDSTTPWTVTATDGTSTASTTVLITTNKEYEVTISFTLYLFQAGDQCTAVTGGWNATGWSTSGTSTVAGTIAGGKMTIGNVAASCILATNQAVPLTGMTLLSVELKTLSTYQTYPAGAIDLYDSKGTVTASRRFAGASISGTVGNYVVTVDLSGLSQTSGFVLVRNGGAIQDYKYEVYNIWLDA